MDEIFGTINPPISSIPADPVAAFGKLISLGIGLFILFIMLIMLVYLLWGAFEWVVSSGDKEKIAKAQLKITNAAVGTLIVVVVLTLYCFITVNILQLSPACFVFMIPSL